MSFYIPVSSLTRLVQTHGWIVFFWAMFIAAIVVAFIISMLVNVNDVFSVTVASLGVLFVPVFIISMIGWNGPETPYEAARGTKAYDTHVLFNSPYVGLAHEQDKPHNWSAMSGAPNYIVLSDAPMHKFGKPAIASGSYHLVKMHYNKGKQRLYYKAVSAPGVHYLKTVKYLLNHKSLFLKSMQVTIPRTIATCEDGSGRKVVIVSGHKPDNKAMHKTIYIYLK